LLELYESTEYSAVTINETWQQKLTRMTKASKVITVEMLAKMFGGVLPEQKSNVDNDDNQATT